MEQQSVSPAQKIFLGKVLAAMGSAVSSELTNFSGWLLAGFAGAVGLLVANVDTVSKFIPVTHLAVVLKLFAAMAVLSVFQRYLAGMVAAGSAVAKTVETFAPPADFDLESFLVEMENSAPRPMRWYVRMTYKKLREGDFAASGRQIVGIAKMQAALIALQVLVVVSAILVLGYGLQA